jgi:hypothetical protein
MRSTIEITIRGDQSRLERLLARVETSLRGGWKRDRRAEERLGRHGSREPWDCCFSCTATADRPAAGLWIHARSPNELYVSTVVPLEKQKLSLEESNDLLVEFHREFLGPAASEVGVEAEVVKHLLTLENELSSDAVELLRDFSANANRASLRSHDRQRWNLFVVRVHRDDSIFDPVLLDEWLQRDGWSDGMRSELLGEYETAQSLLSAYDAEPEKR